MRPPRLTMDDIIVDPPPEGVLVDPARWFDVPGEIELEIGCGKGGFLLRRAQQRPERLFVGIEWANKYFRFAADRMARWGIHNVRIMRTDAAHLVKHHLANECITVLHIYHPDPWPKKRHHKRRLIQPPFVAAAVRILMPGGRWAVQTDHEEYFQQIRDCLLGRSDLTEIPYDDPDSGIENSSVNTNYEIKYRRAQRTIYRIAVVKGGPAAE